MHSALLIDEILQHIFEFILNDGKLSLCSAARCCRAWKSPSLDRIWRQLPSAVPLLSLLSGFSMQNETIRLDATIPDNEYATFHSYAIRVKHIVLRHPVHVDQESVLTRLFHRLCNLESVRIESRATGEVALRTTLAAPRLRALVLQVGYNRSRSLSTTAHDLLSLLKGRTSLEQLCVRGHTSECFHLPLGNITTLRSLSLHLSSLTGQSFVTVSAFPLLVDFDVHASRLSYDDLSTALSCTGGASFFPALEKLKIRAQPELVALILQQLPRNKLRSLHIDATGPGPLSAFEGLFSVMATLPLHEFALEHAIPDDESEDVPVYAPDNFFTLNHLRPLSKLPLRRFILDSSLPPDLPDSAVEEMVKWWPLLNQLELGARTALESVETTWKPRNSLASLCTLARGCKFLESLVITLDADSSAFLDQGPHSFGPHPLASLSISSLSRPDIPSLSKMVVSLFPSLVDVTPGFTGEHEDAWAAVQIAVSNLVHGGS